MVHAKRVGGNFFPGLGVSGRYRISRTAHLYRCSNPIRYLIGQLSRLMPTNSQMEGASTLE